MKGLQGYTVAVAGLVAFSPLPAQAQGYTYSSETEEVATGQTMTSTIDVLGSDYVKVTVSEGGTVVGIMSFNTRDEIMIASDPRTRSYYEINRAMLDQFGGAVTGASSMMEEAMRAARENLSDEQIEEMRKMGIDLPPGMGDEEPAAARTSSRTGPSGTDSTPFGTCTWYDYAYDDGTLDARYCIPQDRVLGFEASRGAFEGMRRFFESFLEGMGSMASMVPAQQNPMERMDEFDNFPALVEEFDDAGELLTRTRFTTATESNLGPDDFGPEPGFTKQELGRGMR